MSSTPFWKKIHQTVSGYSQNVTEEIVATILKLTQNELMDGLLYYKPYTKKGYDDWVSSDSDMSSYMKEFVHELSNDLNLDSNIAYAIMCNYLMFEYYGKIKEFWQITRIGTTNYLKESIWNFYTAERMFLLKTWRNIFEFLHKDFDFKPQYKDFVDAIDIEDLQDSLMEQFENLISEVFKNIDEKNVYLENWLCRNIREQCEILMVLSLAIKEKPLATAQLSKLLKLFIQNNFSTTPSVYELRQYAKKEDLEELMYSAIGCFFVALESLWEENMSDFWENSRDLHDSLLALHLNSGHALVILAWSILRFKSLPEFENADRIVELFNRQPFVLLQSLLSSDIFKNCAVGDIVLKACHKMMDELCLMFDDRRTLYTSPGIIGVLAEFLKSRELCAICLKNRNGLDSLVEIALEAFPYDFTSFTAIAHTLLGHPEQYKETITLLNNIPSFLSDMTWTVPQEEISVLRRPHPAFPDSDLIVFPINTAVRSYAIFGKHLIQYRGFYSYFMYLEYLIFSLINNGVAERKFDEDLAKKVIAGYGVVTQGITYCVDMDLKVVGLDRMINKLNKMLLHLDGPLLHFELIRSYFDVQNALMLHRHSTFFDTCPEIVWKVFFPKLRSDFIDNDVKNLLFNQYVFEDTIFIKLFQEEEFKDDHNLLLTYIQILHNIMKVKFQFKNFQLSGVAYLFNFVFLQHQSWAYKDEHQKTQITLGCLKIFHYVLQKDVEELNDAEKQIFYLCQHALLNNIYIVESFLGLFIKEKYHLMYLMERESNWTNGRSLDRLKCIRMQLALLLLIMNQRKTFGKCALDDRLSFIVKPVASYFTNSYSSVIAELSCRFLEKLAQDQYIPLLALLELDHYQVQSLFLERLRDPLEEEKVKIAIIDLIHTCISNQNGMTAAFFNLKCFMYWDGAENDVFNGDSVSDFMVDYLQNIKKSHEYFKNPLQLGILRLLYNLWLNHRENLIENIANLKDFWPVMADPFFCDYVQELEVYTVILKIMNLEIGSNIDNVEENLIKTMEKFLNDKERLQSWIEFVIKSSESSSKSNLDLLGAWIEFLVLAKKVMANNFNDNIKNILLHSCLDGLNIPEGGFGNMVTMYMWAQLYLMLITTWPVHEKQQKDVVNKLTTFMKSLNAYYKYLPSKIKETILSLINRTLTDMKKIFTEDVGALMMFLNPLGGIIDYEYEYLLSEVWNITDDVEKIKSLKPWLLIIFIGNSALAFQDIKDIGIWFHYRNYLQNIMNSVCSMMQHQATLPFAKLAIDFMISYAESSLIKDFLAIDLFSFYYKVRPPGLTISVGEAVFAGLPVNIKEWWLIFITLIKLNRILMENLGGVIFKACFSLITQHDELLMEIISLTKFTVDMTALTLVCEALKLVYIVFEQMPQWRVVHTHSYDLLMEGMKTTVNASVLSILGYKKINFYTIHGKQVAIMNCAPTDLLISVLNKLTEIIYWACSCLRKTKPDPIAQMNVEHLMEHITLLVDNDFSVPRFELPITSKLTYGTLLCLADYLCKTLNQLSPETPSATPRNRQVSLTELEKDIKVKNLGKIFEYCTATYEKHIGFMIFMQRSDDLPNEKLSSFLHYDMSEFSGTTSAISQLDYHMVKNSLESLMSFLACEIFYTMRSLNEEALFSYKRELSSEIQFFYEFVRKRTSEQYNAMVATPRSSTTSLSQSETNIIKRYMVTKVRDGDYNDIADNNFVLVVSQWLINVCHLSN